MTKKKIIIIAVAVLTIIALLAIAVPVLAADSPTPTTPAQITPGNKAKVLIHLLLVQDPAKVDAFIAQAESANKITTDQGDKIKDFWTAYHAQFTKNIILKRLLSAKDRAKVKAFLDNAVAKGKIKSEQETKILQIWGILHNATPAVTTAP